jgi:hypothetical protein
LHRARTSCTADFASLANGGVGRSGALSATRAEAANRRDASTLARGWIAALPEGGYVVTERPAVEFEAINLETLRDFCGTELQVRQTLAEVLPET